ncbi:hypothetical protein BIW11_01848 [Tropilaelaps mercedesae]|uniref:Lysosomal acid phosphatase-like n=1 Tax=Tropilaelaps mercedesae TaxID=418985 RepID=A0A1V9X760_9ACAR|nr:hypothetical protein BIW11_01848 [Tropilaelaps mercedesae]
MQQGRYHNDRLESVFVVHRHSLRAPVYYPPSHSELNPRFYPRGEGYLTRKGINACLDVAQVWQSWYPNHINGRDHSAVFVRSSESPRCHETAQALLASLFNTSGQGFTPVPVYGPPPGLDKYVSLKGYGRSIDAEMRKHYMDPITDSGSISGATFGDSLEYAKRAFGHPKASEFDTFTYLDAIMSNIYEGFPLPKFWVENEVAMKAVFHKCYWLVIEQYRPFFGGHLLKGMAERMQKVFNDELKTGSRWCDYSYHDYTVSSVMQALEGEVTQHKPDFLGAIFFELRRMNDGTKWVEIWYSSGLKSDFSYSDKEPMRMAWNGGSHRVEFDKLYPRMFHNNYLNQLVDQSNKTYVLENAMV